MDTCLTASFLLVTDPVTRLGRGGAARVDSMQPWLLCASAWVSSTFHFNFTWQGSANV